MSKYHYGFFVGSNIAAVYDPEELRQRKVLVYPRDMNRRAL